MPSKGRNIIVVGASAGGLEALDDLVGRLSTDIPASIFVTHHIAPEGSASPLLERLGRHHAFRCKLATDGEVFERGRIYIAPPDRHLLVKKTQVLVTKGARENRNRPGIDPLFRSAAVNHGPHVIGVVLTGMLDDGTAGLTAIKRCGGLAVVQDPAEAAYPGMPQSALANLRVDHCVRLAEMAPLLDELTRERAGPGKPIPGDVTTEAIIAERVLSDLPAVNSLGSLVPYNCPNCGGVLWSMRAAQSERFRCHTGHSFTAPALLAAQTERIEETLWIALRMFEERRNLLNTMASTSVAGGTSSQARAREAKIHIERIRAILLAPGLAEGMAGNGDGKPATRRNNRARITGLPRRKGRRSKR